MPKDSIPQDKEDVLKDITEALKTSTFQFDKNWKCIFDFSFEEMKITNGVWSYDSITKIITIKEAGDNKSIVMQITVEKLTNGEYFFYLQETPVRLKMIK